MVAIQRTLGPLDLRRDGGGALRDARSLVIALGDRALDRLADCPAAGG